jgi:hypothetical protein
MIAATSRWYATAHARSATPAAPRAGVAKGAEGLEPPTRPDGLVSDLGNPAPRCESIAGLFLWREKVMNLDFLADPSITAISTIILAAITGIYAFLTFLIARSNKQMVNQIKLQNNAMLRPVVGFRIENRQGTIISLVLENSGKSTATNIRLKIDRDFFQYAQKEQRRNLKNFNAFKREIASMAAGEKIHFDLAQGFKFDESCDGTLLTPMEFEIEITYKFGDQQYQETQFIDIKPYMSSLAVRDPLEFIEQVNNSLKKIEMALRNR